MFTQGSIAQSIWRALVAALSFAIPLIGMALPGWESITVGSIVYAILHYAQKQVGL
jgi:hypothetical protein